MLREAGSLLAERQRSARNVLPELPPYFDDVASATAVVTTFASHPMVAGAAAFQNGRMIAYLLAEQVTDMLWGRSLWIRLPGCAVAEGIDREIVRDLYATVAAPLVKQGCINHVAILPVADTALIHSVFSLCFGIEQIHGIADLHSLDIFPPELAEGLTIRQAGAGDREILESFSDTIWRYQVLAPVWGIHLPETQDERRKSYGDMAEDKEAVVYVAFVKGEPAGMQAYFPPEADDPLDMLNHRDGLELCVAGTRDQFRGRGIGTALTQYGFYAAREAGCRYVLTDWRSTNLLSSRFWPRRGFKPVAYRLTRRVDDRILWGGERP